MRFKRNTIKTGLFALFLFLSWGAFAHPASTSAVYVHIDGQTINLHVQIPVEQLNMARDDADLPDTIDGSLSSQQKQALSTYVLAHTVFEPENPIDVSLQHAEYQLIDLSGETYIDGHLALLSSSPLPASHITLRYDAVQHVVKNHRALIYLASDFEQGMIEVEPVLVDVMRFRHNNITFDRDNASLTTGLGRIFHHGIAHILDGTDHLLFLICLLLPAPLIAAKKRWHYDSAHRGQLKTVIKVVTAFTVGHSFTLLLMATGVFMLPNRPVEIVVAASVMLAATQAIKPLFGNHTAWIALLFGLVHGMAFSSAISVSSMSLSSQLWAVLAFNVGIETAQVVIVLLVMPCLLFWARYSGYHWLKNIGAAIAFIFAGAWVVERVTEQPNTLSIWSEQGPLALLICLVTLIASALVGKLLLAKPASAT